MVSKNRKRTARLILTVAVLVSVAVAVNGCFPNMMAQQQQSVKTDPMYSPDGMKLAFISTHDGDPEIFVMNADGGGLKKLTDNTAVDAAPSWSPDGGKIVFTSDRSGSFELYRMNADGSQQQMIPTPVEGM
jgi:Tol biopolymer transport system component